MDRIFSYFGDHEVSLTIVIIAVALVYSLSSYMFRGLWVGADTDLPPSPESNADRKAEPPAPVEKQAEPAPPPPPQGRQFPNTEFEPEAEEEPSGLRPLDFDVGNRDRRFRRLVEQRQAPQAQPFEVPKDVPKAPLDTPKAEPAARYMNLAFMRSQQVVPWPQSLEPSTAYDLRFNIGSLAPDRIPDEREQPPTSFPAASLPPSIEGHWLDVVAASRDFVINKGKFRVFLPDDGEHPHRCSLDQRRPYLLIPVTTPTQPGDFELRVGVYFEKNLLQSCLVKAKAAADSHEAHQWVETDYTMNGTLADLGKLQTKTVNILTGKIVGGEQGFVINGDFDELVTFQLSENQLADAANAARQKLRDIHLAEENTWLKGKRFINKFNKDNAKSKADFIEDLRQTAPLGYLLWRALFLVNSEMRDTLSDDILRDPSTIQIARASTNFVFPWGLVYDIRLDSDKSKHTICKIVETWRDDKGLPVEGMVKCPYETEHKVNTLCPFGFWGFRHVIEQPPSVKWSSSLASEIRVKSPPPRLFVCASNDLEAAYTAPHLAEIKGLQFDFVACSTKDELLSRLRTVDPGVVYLYCHGGRTKLPGTEHGFTPFLVVGAAEKLEDGDILLALAEAGPGLYWALANPLIFINGCHTAELSPEGLVNFVDAFAAIYSSGVIGTEVTVHQQLANEVGADFLRRFRNESVGEGLQHMRNRLLCKGNLMGLAYTAYCLSALRISDTARLTAADTRPMGP